MPKRKKKSDEQPEFNLSKDAREHRAEFARKADAEIVLKHSCDQTKIEVLLHQSKNREIVEWLLQYINKCINMIEFYELDGSYDEEDAKQDLYNDLSKKTIPRFIESGDWMYWKGLNTYLGIAIEHLLSDYRKYLERRSSEDKRELRLDAETMFDTAIDDVQEIGGEAAGEITLDEKNNPLENILLVLSNAEKEWFLEILLNSSLTIRQKKLVILRLDKTPHKEAAKELGCSTKTIQRDEKEISNNTEFKNLILREMSKAKQFIVPKKKREE